MKAGGYPRGHLEGWRKTKFCIFLTHGVGCFWAVDTETLVGSPPLLFFSVLFFLFSLDCVKEFYVLNVFKWAIIIRLFFMVKHEDCLVH